MWAMSDLASQIILVLYLPKRIGIGIIKKNGYDIYSRDSSFIRWLSAMRSAPSQSWADALGWQKAGSLKNISDTTRVHGDDQLDKYKPEMSFEENTADGYDEDAIRGDEIATVAFLEQLAQGGRALELAIGTGRIALPLAEKGIRVDGIDFSPSMLAKLRAKPGGEQLKITLGNFADVAVPDTYNLIYIVFNTLFNLLTQGEQVRCFENVAAHLTEKGVFVIEGGVPTEFCRLRKNQYVELENIEIDKVHLDTARYNPITQLLEENHIIISNKGTQLFPIVTRYAWPSELDLMARIAGLRIKERWANWNREPLTASSNNCISVYGR
jgi:SAM-dependent methyltransferase